MARAKKPNKQVTRYTYDDIKEPRTPETGHTMLMDDEYQVVRVSMDNGWKQAINVGKLEGEPETVLIDMDPLIDPLLVWSGKKSTVDVPVLPLQRNEIVSESRIKQIIDRAKKKATEKRGEGEQLSLTFADLEKELRESDRERRVDFYTHEEGWRNKLICGDSLHVMQSLIQYEGLRGRVQVAYIDPPYGVRYDSNFQQRVDSNRNAKGDEADDVLTIRAFRDTWLLGVHSYLSYLQERLYLTREILAETGSVFVQISDDNVHLVRSLMDEVFGAANFVAQIAFTKTAGATSQRLSGVCDYLLWYAKSRNQMVYNQLYLQKDVGGAGAAKYTFVQMADGTRRRMTADEQGGRAELPVGARVFRKDTLVSQGFRQNTTVDFEWRGKSYHPGPNNNWKTTLEGLRALDVEGRIIEEGKSLAYVRFIDDFPAFPLSNIWADVGGIQSRTDPKVYVVQTSTSVVSRAIAMASNPGDLVLDITCGSGTTAYCAERLGRRWVTCDTSRVAINVARTRLLSAVFDAYRTLGLRVKDDFEYESVTRTTLRSVAYGLEPERIALRDRPLCDQGAVRVCGPFEVLALGRYALTDWNGFVAREDGGLAGYVEVISRLYAPESSTESASGMIHAVVRGDKQGFGVSVGPVSARVTARQIADAAQDALALGLNEVHILGWSFEANVGEVKVKLESRGAITVRLLMIRPDTLVAGLKVTDRAGLFSPLALPEARAEPVLTSDGPLVRVVLGGVGIFDRALQTVDFKPVDSGYVSAWYLDEDYDGDCFIDCQMFFDFKKHPNLKPIVSEEVDGREFSMRYESETFPVGQYRVCAVRVVDVYGNESTMTIPLEPEAD